LLQRVPAGHELGVNATPLVMKVSDPLPLDVDRLAPVTWVGEVVMTQAYTPMLRAAQARPCPLQRRTAMLYEMIPAYLRFFDLPGATPEQLRALAEIRD
ncbi:shikimate dehydrogenase, partial [Klebsiella quasipneumoniae]